MKKILALIIAAAVFPIAANAEIPSGVFSDMTFFPETGDEGGIEITISKNNGKINAVYEEAQGERMGKIQLKDFTVNEKTGVGTFSIKRFDKVTICTLTFVKGGAVLSMKGEMSYLLPASGATFTLPPEDTFDYVKGVIREKPAKDSKVLFDLSSPGKAVIAPDRNDPDEEMCEIVYNGKKGFADKNDIGKTSAQMIIGDKVRFRDKPSIGGTVIAEFSKWTLVGGICLENDTWVRITYKGTIGFVAREYITGY